MDRKTKITLGILLSNIFIAFLGIGLVIPVLPSLMNELNIDGTTVGYITAMFALAQLIASPLTGKAADKFGRKNMIVIGLFLFGISEFLFAIGEVVPVLFISRALGGISAAFIMPAVSAFIADITTDETRPKAYGYMGAVISTGFIIGPGVGGFLAELGIRIPFFAAGFLGIAAGILSLIILREPDRQVSEQKPVIEKNGVLRKVLMPLFLMAFMVIFISGFGLMGFETYFGLYVDAKLGFTSGDIAFMITVSGIVGVIMQIAFFERLIKWKGEINLIRLMLVLSAIFVGVFPLLNSYWGIFITTIFIFAFFDLIRPAVTTYLANIAGDDQGFVGGINSFFTSLANVIAPIICGILFDIDIAYTFYFAAITIGLGFILALFWKKPKSI